LQRHEQGAGRGDRAQVYNVDASLAHQRRNRLARRSAAALILAISSSE